MNDKQRKSVFRFAHFAMGTTFELLIAEKDEDYASQVSHAVFAEIDRIKDLISRFNPTSEIGQINRLRAGQVLRIGVETYECLKTALFLHSETHGAFDINVGSLMKYREMQISESRPPRTDRPRRQANPRCGEGRPAGSVPPHRGGGDGHRRGPTDAAECCGRRRAAPASGSEPWRPRKR